MAPEEAGKTGRKSAADKSNSSKEKSKTKPSYKHVPHSQKPAHLVAKRNARERRRVQAVNQAFYRLRKCVPIENRNKRVSKVKTLQRAIDYIRKLERILESDDVGSGGAGGTGELLVLGDGTVLTTSVASSSPTRAPARQRHNNNCDSRTSSASRQRRPRKSKAAPDLVPASQIGAQPAPSTPANAANTSYPEASLVQQPDYYSYQPSELVLRESSAYNSNLNHYYNSDATYLASAPASQFQQQPPQQQPQPQTQPQLQPQTSPPSVGEQTFGGDYTGGYPSAYFYYQQQQHHQEPQTASGGWRNQQTIPKPEVATFGAEVARASPAVDELSAPKLANRQQVNTGYLAAHRMGPPVPAHLSFTAASNDNYQQQQLDGVARKTEAHNRAHNQHPANCLPADSLHDQHQYQRHFSSANHHQTNNLLQQDYGAAI